MPDRLEFDLTTEANSISAETPAKITLDGRFLYGAPAADLGLEGEVNIAKAAERPGYSRLCVRPRRRLTMTSFEPRPFRSTTCRRPTPDGKATFNVALGKVPASTRPLEATIVLRLAEPGGRAVERKLTLPITRRRR